ncbi:MAG: hypothetical protein HY796_11515 [Elusimicrobia bacterium]|nr:hypothetical protein [Elusimicrobiota bacterium]
MFAFALYPIFAAGAPGNSAALLMTVTPNRDGKNDTFIFRCYNPWDFRITATIYGLRGERLASMRIKSDKSITYPYDYLEWDPDSGARAPGGLYLYEVIVNNKAYKGTVAVIR